MTGVTTKAERTAIAAKVGALIEARIAARNARDFAESDRLRAEIVGLGVVLMDAKDPVTGEFSSTWHFAKTVKADGAP
ncbi:MAG: hypothetical protein NTZ14_12070 [Hyphomicrobiales bacterium]|nr:hypothetical protein [Hyphomicrobiales bacterium]